MKFICYIFVLLSGHGGTIASIIFYTDHNIREKDGFRLSTQQMLMHQIAYYFYELSLRFLTPMMGFCNHMQLIL